MFTLIVLIASGWLLLSFVLGTAWGMFSWFFGTRDCNRHGIIRAEQERLRFVRENMSRYPVEP